MRVLILLGERTRIERVVDRLSAGSDHEYVVVTLYDIVKELGRRISNTPKRERIHLHVFKDSYPEENALKIITHNSPDIVIDCDPDNRLFFVKKLLSNTLIDIIRCDE